ncbi:uncharacterized protein RHOBADRAFT_55623, partial [Rhodotorula graminis WP1]
EAHRLDVLAALAARRLRLRRHGRRRGPAVRTASAPLWRRRRRRCGARLGRGRPARVVRRRRRGRAERPPRTHQGARLAAVHARLACGPPRRRCRRRPRVAQAAPQPVPPSRRLDLDLDLDLEPPSRRTSPRRAAPLALGKPGPSTAPPASAPVAVAPTSAPPPRPGPHPAHDAAAATERRRARARAAARRARRAPEGHGLGGPGEPVCRARRRDGEAAEGREAGRAARDDHLRQARPAHPDIGPVHGRPHVVVALGRPLHLYRAQAPLPTGAAPLAHPALDPAQTEQVPRGPARGRGSRTGGGQEQGRPPRRRRRRSSSSSARAPADAGDAQAQGARSGRRRRRCSSGRARRRGAAQARAHVWWRPRRRRAPGPAVTCTRAL